jgi:glutathione S-transferase
MKLYQLPQSNHCLNVRLVAHEVGEKLELIDVDFFGGEIQKPEYLRKNPNGRIPTFEDGDFVLWESNAITAYLAALHPEKGLLPTDARARADVDRWLHWQSAHLTPAFVSVLYERVLKKIKNEGEPDEKVLEASLQNLKRYLGLLNQHLEGAQFLCNKLSIADFAIAATLSPRRAARIDLAPYGAVVAWLGRIESRESWKKNIFPAFA